MAADCINFKSLGYGDLRIGTQFINKATLESLFQLRNCVLADDQGDEIIVQSDGSYPALDPSKTYTVVDEADLAEEDETVEKILDPSAVIERLQGMKDERLKFIQHNYHPLHPLLFKLQEGHIGERFLSGLKEFQKTKDPNAIFSLFHQETKTGIYSFELFSKQFCNELIEEVEHFERSGLPLARPNSMNKYGLILDELGFQDFFTELSKSYLEPVIEVLYPQTPRPLDQHHAFIVQYKLTDGDKDLGFHFDDSEITVNVCLGRSFSGGSLYFAGLVEDPSTHDEQFAYDHTPLKALIHIGKHRHGVKPLISGERYNLILWLRCSQYRQKLHEQTCPHHSGDNDHHHHHHHTHSENQHHYLDETH